MVVIATKQSVGNSVVILDEAAALRRLVLSRLARPFAWVRRRPTVGAAPFWPDELPNDPERRRGELNAYLPDNLTLEWRPLYAEWHTDEINAWAMEQEVFRRLRLLRAQHIKGEIFAALPAVLDNTWHSAVSTTPRPAGPVEVTIGREEKITEP